MNKLALMAAAGAAALLAGCGGGGDSTTVVIPPTDAIPAQASQTSQGLANYLDRLSMDNSETKEPLDLSSFVPSTSETEEPQPLT